MQQRSNENLANFRKHIFEGLRINSVKSEATKIHISMTHSRVKMNSTNWPTANLRVFIAQMVEHYSANTEAMGLNPVEVNLQLLKLQLLPATIIFQFKSVFPQFTSSSLIEKVA